MNLKKPVDTWYVIRYQTEKRFDNEWLEGGWFKTEKEALDEAKKAMERPSTTQRRWLNYRVIHVQETMVMEGRRPIGNWKLRTPSGVSSGDS